METEEMMSAVEEIGRRAAEVRDALGSAEVPGRDQPLAGVARSSVARCRQLAAEMAAMSGEMSTQLRMFSTSVSRGQRIAKMQRLAQAAAKGRRAAPTAERGPDMEQEPGGDPEEDDRWDEWDDL